MDYKEYLQKTKENYKSENKADEYKQAYESRINFRNFRAKIIANRERSIVKSFLNYLLGQKDVTIKNVCDVPVGTGKITNILLDFDLKVTSGDISEEMMDFIDPQLKNHPNYMKEKVINASSLPFSDNTFDLLVNIRLMHRVDPSTRSKILKEAHRVTKKYYIVSFGIKRSGISNWFQKIKLKLTSRTPDPGAIKRKKVRKEIKDIGFDIIKEKDVLPVLSQEAVFLLRKR